MTIGNEIFTTMVIPGPVNGGGQQVSIGIDLNIEHEVFNDSSPDPTKWKKDILLFTKIVRIAMESHAFSLDCNNGLPPLPIIFNDLEKSESVHRLWAGMLGYQFAGGTAVIREKKWLENGSQLELNKLNKNTWELTAFQGQTVLGAPSTAVPNRGAVTSLKDITQRVDDNPILSQIAGHGLSQQVVAGIQIAHEAAIRKEKGRNDAILELAKKNLKITEHPVIHDLLQAAKAGGDIKDPATRILLDKLVAFYHSAQYVINERDYIREAIDKLSMNLKVREYLGTMIHGNVIFVDKNTSKLNLHIDEGKLLTALSANGISIKYPHYFSGNVRTAVASSGSPGKIVVLAAPVPDVNYVHYYTNTVALLFKKSAVLSWETESARHNRDLAVRNMNENEQLTDASYDPVKYEQLKNGASQAPDHLEQLQAAAISRTVLIKAAVKINNQISNVQTKGHQLYIVDKEWLDYDPSAKRPDNSLYEHDLIAGFLVYLKMDGKIYCLNDVTEYFGPWVNPSELNNGLLKKTAIPIGTDAMVHAAVAPKDGEPVDTPYNSIQGIHSGFQFLWDGTTVTNTNPMRHQEGGSKDEASKAADLISDFASHKDEMAIESLVLNLYSRRWMSKMHYPFHQKKKTRASEHLLARSFLFSDEKLPRALLKFTREAKYQYALAGQYHNGFAQTPQELLDKVAGAFTEPCNFLRDDHIKAPIVALPFPIYEDSKHKTLKKEYLGESNVDFVIRKSRMVQYGYVECVRHILPPQIPNFQIYLWYDMRSQDAFTKSRKLTDGELLKWYKKSQKEGIDGDALEEQANHAIFNGSLNYLPEPASTGFVIRFYYDRDCTLDHNKYPETFCSYSDLPYPQMPSWKIVLCELSGRQKTVETDRLARIVYIGIMPGQQVFAEIFAAFDADFACFSDPVIVGPDFTGKPSDKSYYYDLLKCGVQKMSFTYACQYPLIKPQIKSIDLSRFMTGTLNKKPSTSEISMKINYEHLNLWNGITVPDEQPTGELDVYMLWDDYSLNMSGIQKSIIEKTNKEITGGNYLHVGRVNFFDEKNKAGIYHNNLKTIGDRSLHAENAELQDASISFELDAAFNIAYFTNAVFRIRNVSKFPAYFQRLEFSKMGDSTKEHFSYWSEPFYLDDPFEKNAKINYPSPQNSIGSYLFNNQKPSTPVIEKIVPLIVRDAYENHKVIFYQRIRIYFSQVPLTGEQNRIGFVVREPSSVYKNFLKGHISMAGIDIVTDQMGALLDLQDDQLSAANFNMHETLLEPAYLKNFSPQYDNDPVLGQPFPVGLVNYILCYDSDQSLWYVDIEIDLKGKNKQQFHNPFVQLFLTAYQPFSANYNAATGAIADDATGFANDYRLSAPVKAEFFSIFPTREFAQPMILCKRHPKLWCTLAGNTSSLFINLADGEKLHTDFIVSVQRKLAHDIWENCDLESMTIKFRLDGKEIAPVISTGPYSYMSLFNQFRDSLAGAQDFECDFRIHFSKNIFHSYRAVIQEVDLFNGLGMQQLQDILMSGDKPPIMTVDGVYIRGTYIFE